MIEPSDARTPFRGMLTRSQFIAIISGIAAVAIGMITAIWTPARVTILKWILGGVFLFVGLSDSVDAFGNRKEGSYWPFQLVRGIVSVVFGLLILAWTDISSAGLAYLIGINLLVYGVIAVGISRAIPPDVEAHSRNLWRGVLALGIGIVLVLLPDRSVFVIAMIIGVYLICFGILLLVSSYQLQRLRDRNSAPEQIPPQDEGGEPTAGAA